MKRIQQMLRFLRTMTLRIPHAVKTSAGYCVRQSTRFKKWLTTVPDLIRSIPSRLAKWWRGEHPTMKLAWGMALLSVVLIAALTVADVGP